MKYKDFMIDRGNNALTSGKSLARLKLFMSWAKTDGIIKENPLDGIKIHRGQGSRNFLDFKELETLEKLYAFKTLP